MIYFDNAATTMPSKKAIDYAKKFNEDMFYNPSALYQEGINNSKEIKKAKGIILNSLGVSEDKYEVVFTSCGSESDNTAIFCSVKKGSYLTDKGEHSAVYKSFIELKNRGNVVYFSGLNSNGSVKKEEIYDYVRHNRVDFISVVHVNNETGAINDINEISKKVKEINPDIIFHSDGVQAYGKLEYKLADTIDFYSISAHKVNALKGLGVLVKKKNKTLSPLIFGGGQENGYRSGTENIFGIKVFEYAVLDHYENIKSNYELVKSIKDYIVTNLNKSLFKIVSDESCSPYILSLSAFGLRGEVIMHLLEQHKILIGNGSACSSKNRYSRVIEACGYNKNFLDGMIRLSFSNENTIEEAKYVTKKLNEVVYNLKGMMN